MNISGRRSSSAANTGKTRISALHDLVTDVGRAGSHSFSADINQNRFDEKFSLKAVIWHGDLYKSGKNDTSPTKKRYFILHRDHVLTYHSPPKDFTVINNPNIHMQLAGSLKGTIPLVDAKLEFNEGEKPFSISVPGRLYHLSSETESRSIEVVQYIKDSINATHKLSMNDELVVEPYMPMSVQDDYACMILPESTLHQTMFTSFLTEIMKENQSHKYNEIKTLMLRSLNRNLTESEKKLTQDFLQNREECRLREIGRR